MGAGRVRRALAVLLVAALASVGSDAAHAAGGCDQPGLISAAQLQKLLAYVRSDVGAPAVFYAPFPRDFGWTADTSANAPIREVATDDYAQSFAQSDANTDDYVITARVGGGVWFFVTGPAFCLRRALYRRENGPPQVMDAAAADVRAQYRRALRAWAVDLGRSPPAP